MKKEDVIKKLEALMLYAGNCAEGPSEPEFSQFLNIEADLRDIILEIKRDQPSEIPVNTVKRFSDWMKDNEGSPYAAMTLAVFKYMHDQSLKNPPEYVSFGDDPYHDNEAMKAAVAAMPKRESSPVNITAAMIEAGARACSQWFKGKKYPFPTYDDLLTENKQMYAEQALNCLTAALSKIEGGKS